MKSKFSYIEQGEPVTLEELGKVDGCANEDYHSYLETCIASILKVKGSTLFYNCSRHFYQDTTVDLALKSSISIFTSTDGFVLKVVL